MARGTHPTRHRFLNHQDDASLGWTSPGGKYSATFYVNNVFNGEYKENANLVTSSAPFYVSLNTTKPRSYGLVLKANF